MGALSITIVDCAPRLIAYDRRRATLKSVSAVAASSPVWSMVFDRNIPSTDTPIAVFIDAGGENLFGGDGVLVDIGIEVLGPFEDDLVLRCGQTPSGRAAMACFKGPYDGIEGAHRAIRGWCAENGHALAGPIWEICIWNQDPVLLETRVHYLLA